MRDQVGTSLVTGKSLIEDKAKQFQIKIHRNNFTNKIVKSRGTLNRKHLPE